MRKRKSIDFWRFWHSSGAQPGFICAFGSTVAISGDTVVVGAPSLVFPTYHSGRVFIFTRSGTTWAKQALLGSDVLISQEHFWKSVTIKGDRLTMGVPE